MGKIWLLPSKINLPAAIFKHISEIRYQGKYSQVFTLIATCTGIQYLPWYSILQIFLTKIE